MNTLCALINLDTATILISGGDLEGTVILGIVLGSLVATSLMIVGVVLLCMFHKRLKNRNMMWETQVGVHNETIP